MTLFDRYVVVDWSAAARPTTGPNSIWIARIDESQEVVLSNPATRAAAAAELRTLCTSSSRTLLAVDASLGYPAGSASWFGLDAGSPWRSMWQAVSDHLVDGPANDNNRFEVAARLNRRGGGVGPFWGRPPGREVDGLSATKPSTFPIPEFRRCEEVLRASGRRPSSCWQLLGAGSVGGQTLTLLPLLGEMLAAGDIDVWPFTTGLGAPHVERGRVVVAETWPTAFDLEYPTHMVRDAAQVAGVARAIRDADAHDELAAWFTPDVAAEAHVVDEEGWVLWPVQGRAGTARDHRSG